MKAIHTKKCEELQSKIIDFIRSVTNNSGSYAEDYMKIKFNSDDDIPLKKLVELYNMIIIVRSVFVKEANIIPKSS